MSGELTKGVITSKPKDGDRTVCKECKGPIESRGGFWTHWGLKKQPAHAAIPTPDVPLRRRV